MDSGFITIVQKLVTERGKEVLLNQSKCKSFLADYAKNEYKKECRLLLQLLETGCQNVIANTNDIENVLPKIVQQLEYVYIPEQVAREIVELLVLVLRGENIIIPTTQKEPVIPVQTATVNYAPQLVQPQQNAYSQPSQVSPPSVQLSTFTNTPATEGEKNEIEQSNEEDSGLWELGWGAMLGGTMLTMLAFSISFVIGKELTDIIYWIIFGVGAVVGAVLYVGSDIVKAAMNGAWIGEVLAIIFIVAIVGNDSEEWNLFHSIVGDLGLVLGGVVGTNFGKIGNIAKGALIGACGGIIIGFGIGLITGNVLIGVFLGGIIGCVSGVVVGRLFK